jgi:hypothetical protein
MMIYDAYSQYFPHQLKNGRPPLFPPKWLLAATLQVATPKKMLSKMH